MHRLLFRGSIGLVSWPPSSAEGSGFLTNHSTRCAIIAAILAQELVEVLGLIKGAHAGDLVASSDHGDNFSVLDSQKRCTGRCQVQSVRRFVCDLGT